MGGRFSVFSCQFCGDALACELDPVERQIGGLVVGWLVDDEEFVGEKTFYVLYGATMSLSRRFIPGIHKNIPIAVYVNGDLPVPNNTPVPIREQVAEAMKIASKMNTTTGSK